MPRYANLGGDSGVRSYELGTDSITVQFGDGSIYEYNAIRPGAAQVNEMKALAEAGHGLNSFINRRVRKNYYRKR